MRELVFCADDYAASDGISSAILQLASMGRLTATSAMVLSPRWAEDAARLQPLRGQFDVGLHLDFTSDFAIAAGHGDTLPRILLRALARRWRAEQLRPVVDAQLDAFEAHWGAPPDHVDGHQHVHQLPVLREVLLERLSARYPAESRRPWLRVSRVEHAGLKGQVITALGARVFTRQAARAGWACAPTLTGVYGFDTDAEGYGEHMRQWLARAGRNALLMCHPGWPPARVTHDNDVTEPPDVIAKARAAEYEWLASPAFDRALKRARVRLARGSDLYSTAP